MIVSDAPQFRLGCVTVIGKDAPLLEVGEEGLHRIKILGGEWIILVVVTFAATHRRAQPRHRDRPHPVRGIFGQILLGLRAPLPGHHVQPVEPRGHVSIHGRIRQEVARKLLDSEFVERFISVKSADDIVTIRENILILVPVILHRIRIPHHVRPRHSHPLPEVR